jgi:hypothetical protein
MPTSCVRRFKLACEGLSSVMEAGGLLPFAPKYPLAAQMRQGPAPWPLLSPGLTLTASPAEVWCDTDSYCDRSDRVTNRESVNAEDRHGIQATADDSANEAPVRTWTRHRSPRDSGRRRASWRNHTDPLYQSANSYEIELRIAQLATAPVVAPPTTPSSQVWNCRKHLNFPLQTRDYP